MAHTIADTGTANSRDRIERVRLVFITATALPMLVALTAVGVADGTMTTAAQASVIGAGVLSVLLFPLVAVGLQRRKFAVTGGGPGLPDRPTEPRAQG